MSFESKRIVAGIAGLIILVAVLWVGLFNPASRAEAKKPVIERSIKLSDPVNRVDIMSDGTIVFIYQEDINGRRFEEIVNITSLKK